MNNFYKLLLILSIFIIGCTSNIIEEKKDFAKEIDSLDLNIFSKNGEKKFTISSPYSIYDNFKNKFQFKKTTINIFQDEKIKYIIDSDESSFSRNNKVLELNGNVKLKTINQDEDYLSADNFIWSIDEGNYLLTGNIRFENKNVMIIIKLCALFIFELTYNWNGFRKT